MNFARDLYMKLKKRETREIIIKQLTVIQKLREAQSKPLLSSSSLSIAKVFKAHSDQGVYCLPCTKFSHRVL